MSAAPEPALNVLPPFPRRRGVPSDPVERLRHALALARARHGRGFSIAQLATRSGVSERQIRHLEDAASLPTLGTAMKLAKALAVPAGRLFKEDRRLRPEKRGVTLK